MGKKGEKNPSMLICANIPEMGANIIVKMGQKCLAVLTYNKAGRVKQEDMIRRKHPKTFRKKQCCQFVSIRKNILETW